MSSRGTLRTIITVLKGGIMGSVSLTAVGISLWLGYWRLDHKTVLSVESNSMVPTFRAGDAVIVDTQTTRLTPGQVISFTSSKDPGVTISHRLVAITANGKQYVTQGDALNSPDPVIMPDQVVGKAIGVMPGFGRVLHYARSPLGLLFSVYVPATWILYKEFCRVQRHWANKLYIQWGWKPKRSATNGRLVA